MCVCGFIASDKAKKKIGVVLYVNPKLELKQVFKDEGRIIGVEITIVGRKILLVELYAPNEKKEFCKKLDYLLFEKYDGNVIWFQGIWTEQLHPMWFQRVSYQRCFLRWHKIQICNMYGDLNSHWLQIS